MDKMIVNRKSSGENPAIDFDLQANYITLDEYGPFVIDEVRNRDPL